MKNKKTILLLVLAALVGATLYYMKARRPLEVSVVKWEENVKVQVFGLGTVEARIISKVGFKISNPVTVLKADEKDHVRKGQILARLDNSEQLARISKAKAGLQSAKAAIAGAKASILRVKAIEAQKKRSHRRKQQLLRKRTISPETAEEAKLEYDKARADINIANSNLLAANAALETAKAQLVADKVTLDQHILKAPFDAVVVTRHMELGTVVKAGEPLFTLVDPKTVWVLGHISENRSGAIRIGQSANIRLRSKPHELYKGKVVRIDIESDRVTEERNVYVSCKPCLDNFHLGEQAEIYITTDNVQKALFVPENAVDDFDERQLKGKVWVLENGKLKKISVRFAHRTLDARLSILDKLDKEIKILSRLPKRLKEGRAAKIGEDKKS